MLTSILMANVVHLNFNVQLVLSILMTSVMCLNSSMRDKDIIDFEVSCARINVKCHVLTLTNNLLTIVQPTHRPHNLQVLPPSQNDCPTSWIFLVPKWLPGSSTQLEIWGSKSNIFGPNFHHQEVFRHRDCGRRFGVVDVISFKSHTYNHSVNGQRALISPTVGTQTTISGRREGVCKSSSD